MKLLLKYLNMTRLLENTWHQQTERKELIAKCQYKTMLQLSYQKYDWEKFRKLLHLPRVNLPEKRYEIFRSKYEIFNIVKDSTNLLKKENV